MSEWVSKWTTSLLERLVTLKIGIPRYKMNRSCKREYSLIVEGRFFNVWWKGFSEGRCLDIWWKVFIEGRFLDIWWQGFIEGRTYCSISSKKSSRKFCVFLRKFAAVSACAKSDAIWFQPWKHEAYFGKIWVMKPHNTQRKNFCFPKLLKICQKILLHDSCYLLQK